MKQPIRRKPVQIATNSTGDLIALCDDGSIWSFSLDTMAWYQVPQVPTGVDEDLKGFEINVEVNDE